MKKITVLYTIWNMGYGGAERLVLNIIKNLDKDRYKIIVFSDSPKKGPLEEEFKKAGAVVLLSPVNRFRHPVKFVNALKRIIRNYDIDIIHANDDLNMIFPLLAKGERVKFIAHSHNTKFRFTRSRLLSTIVKKATYRLIEKKSDIRLACNEDAGRALFKKLDYDCIHNGIDISQFSFDNKKRNELRRKYSIGKDETVVLNVGRLFKVKNQAFLIEVFDEYRKNNKKAKLVIIGDGEEKANLESKIQEKSLAGYVLLVPSSSNIADYYNIADCFVMTSLYEGMPTVSVEAQANGLKCVFSDTISKDADHSGDSLFVPLEDGPKKWADAISSVCTGRRKTICGDIGDYDAAAISKHISTIYEELVCAPKNK